MQDEVAVTYRSYRYNLWNKKTYLRGVEGVQKPRSMVYGQVNLPELLFKMDELVVHEVARDFELGVLTRLRLTMDGLRVEKRDDSGQFQPAFQVLGYDDPSMAFELDLDFSPNHRILTVNHLKLNGPEVGRLHLAGQVSGIGTQVDGQVSGSVGNALSGAWNALEPVRFHGAELIYDDWGFARRFLNYQAHRQGLSREQLADQIVGQVTRFRRLKPSQSTVQALETFLKTPLRIRIAALPDQPVGRQQLVSSMIPFFGRGLSRTFGIEVTN